MVKFFLSHKKGQNTVGTILAHHQFFVIFFLDFNNNNNPNKIFVKICFSPEFSCVHADRSDSETAVRFWDILDPLM